MRRSHPPRRVFAAAAALACLVLAAGPTAPAAAQPLELAGLRGDSLRTADLAQGTTVLVVWAGWSPRCRDIVERVNALAGKWGGKARVVAINFEEDRHQVEQFLAGKSLRVPVYLDSDGGFSKKNAITSLPGLVVMRDGKAAYAGKLPDDPDRVLADLLG